MIKKSLSSILFLGILLCFTACNDSYFFEQNEDIQNQEWLYDHPTTFEVDITDTTDLYNIYLNVRHTDDYAYANLWVKINTIFPNGSESTLPINIPMADPMGKWYGKGMGSIKSNQIAIQQNAILPTAGTYQFEIEQNMRDNPLQNILDVGLIIEKSAKAEATP